MRQEHENNFEKLREQTRQISELSQKLQVMKSETLDALVKDNAFNEARKRAFDNIGVSTAVVREEIRFMREIIELFPNGFLSEEVKNNRLLSRVILNEHNYFEYWLGHPQLNEVAIDADKVKILASRTRDLDLPTRIMNVLRVLDIDYVFELVDRDPKDFLVYRNMGEKSLKLLKDYVKSQGFDFGYKIRYSEQDKQYYTLSV
ncbi:MAG: hypothetical protein F083_2705 [bacterium F083]|nr:MAG: hypothetical protein F083_2705 [bacterium F083]